MRFAVEFWLWLVPLLPLVWLAHRASDRSARRRREVLLGPRADAHLEGDNPRLRSWQRFFYVAGLFWLLLALARPQWGASEVTVTQQGSDIVVALDISNSMLAEDVLPNRMESAKAQLGSFLDRLENSRVGLVFFAGAAFVQCPLTLDYGTAEIFLNMAGPDMMSEQGTAIGAALATSRELLAKGREGGPDGTFQAILLVTDGEDLEGEWQKEAEACREMGIRVIPVGVGEEGGGLIPVKDRLGRPAGFMKDEEGNVVMTRMELAQLEELAGIGGGSAFRLGIDGLAGDRLFAELERLGRRDLEDRRISAYEERFVWPLLLAVVCFVLRLVLRPRRKETPGGDWRQTGSAAALVLALLGAGGAQAALAPPELADMNTGQRHYLEGDFEQALAAFESALVKAPDEPVIGLAVGEALFQLGRYEDAEREFTRVLDLTEDPALRAEAHYNRGTSRLAAGELKPAVESLRDALRLDPDQPDALHNLDVALQRLRKQEQQEEQQQEQQQEQQEQEQQDQEENEDEQEQQQEQQQDQQDQQEEQEEEQQQQQQQEQDGEQDEEQEQQQQSPEAEQQPEEQQDPQDEQAQPEPDPTELTKEQQEQILKALDRDEEELKRSVQKRLKGGKPKSGKKW